MTTTLARHTPSPRALLARILDDPAAVATVQAMEPRALHALIEDVGLEDAGEIVAMATIEQLEKVFDEDLWRSARPGEDETFDAARFVLWLEVMLEAGAGFAARRLAELPEDLVTLALHRHLLVLELDELLARLGEHSEEAELTEKAFDGCLSHELDTYQLIARRHDGWDAILTVLVALDQDHHDVLQRILGHCCHMSSAHIEDGGGLYDVLTSEEMLEVDVAGEREDRRAREGFIAPSAAASFLALARTTPLAEIVAATEVDPITRAYFRNLDRSVGRTADPADPPDPDARRLDELTYLANVVVAGHGVDGRRRLRPVEAIELVLAMCHVGADHLAAIEHRAADAIRAEERPDRLFRIGWHLTGGTPPPRAIAALPAPPVSR